MTGVFVKIIVAARRGKEQAGWESVYQTKREAGSWKCVDPEPKRGAEGPWEDLRCILEVE